MEFKNYLLLVKKHLFLIITIPVIAMVSSYFFVKQMPNAYVAKTQLVTGLIDRTQRIINDDNGERQNNDAFTNLIETMQLDKVMSQVSYQLLIHDFTQKHPFRVNPKLDEQLSSADKQRIVLMLNQKQASFGLLNSSLKSEARVDSIINVAGYDATRLLKKNLKIYHYEGSDFINVECESENPALSAFIINTLIAKFINYYTTNLTIGRGKSTQFLSNLLNEKQAAMRSKIAQLQAYKIKHNILDMANESKDVYRQVSDLEAYRQQADKDIIAYSGALKSIDNRFNPRDRRYLESTTSRINGVILNTRERLRAMNNKYLESGFDERYKKSVDSLQNVLSNQINESTDKYISNPLAAKDNLVQEKLKMGNSLELARYSSRSLNRQISALKGRLNSLVPAQAVVNSLERDIDIATREYLDVQEKYNQAEVNNILPVQLRQLHPALPGTKQPSKKIFLVALSGIAGFTICLLALLVVFYTDTKVHNSDELERLTGINVLGELNEIPNYKTGQLSAKKDQRLSGILNTYRNLLRDVRFETDNRLKNDQIIAVTSLQNGEGKTLFAFSLAYAYAISNKKVLLIDGNFANPLISKMTVPTMFLEHYLKGNTPNAPIEPDSDVTVTKPNALIASGSQDSLGLTIKRLSKTVNHEYDAMASIDIIGNKGGDTSLLEMTTEAAIKEKIDELKMKYDVVIVETGSLNNMSRAKEWMLFADKVIAVFENNQSLNRQSRKSLQYLCSLNGKMLGWVLNRTKTKVAESQTEMA